MSTRASQASRFHWIRERFAFVLVCSLACALVSGAVACKPKPAAAPPPAGGNSNTNSVQPVTQMQSPQQPAAPAVSAEAAQATGCANPVREEVATATMLKCCAEKGYGTPTTACQESVSKCWADNVWTYLSSLNDACAGQGAATSAAVPARGSQPTQEQTAPNGAPLTLATATCTQLYANPGIGTDNEYCKKCYVEGGVHKAYCDSKGILRDGTERAPYTNTLPSTYNPSTAEKSGTCSWWQYEKIEDTRLWNPFSACEDKQEGNTMWKSCETAGCLGVNISCNCEKFARKTGTKTQRECSVLLGGTWSG